MPIAAWTAKATYTPSLLSAAFFFFSCFLYNIPGSAKNSLTAELLIILLTIKNEVYYT